MSKGIKKLMLGIVALVLVSGGLVAAIFLLPEKHDDTDDTPSESTPEYTLFDIKKADIKSITVKNKEDTLTLLQKKENEWECEELKSLPFEADKYGYLADGLLSLSSPTKITPEDLKNFGLDEPGASIDIALVDETKTLLMGTKAPGGESKYVMLKNDGNVYVLDGYTCEAFEKTKKDFIKTNLISSENTQIDPQTGQTVSTALITKLVLSGTNFPKPVTLVKYTDEEMEELGRMSSLAVLDNGQKHDTDPQKVEPLNSSLISFNASEAMFLNPSNDKLKECGLDKPSAVADLTFEEKTYKITLGKRFKGEDDSYYYYMTFGDYKVIYTLQESYAPWAALQIKDIRSSLLFITSIDNVSKITVKSEQVNAEFILEGSGDELVVKNDGKICDTDNFRNLYQVYIGVSPEEDAASTPKINPVFTLTFTYHDEKTKDTVISLTPNGSRRLFYAINGEGSTNVNENTLDNLIAKTKDYLSGKTVTT